MPHQTTLQVEDTGAAAVLYMALELSDKTWRIGFSAGERDRIVSVGAGDLAGLAMALERARRHFALEGPVRVVSCYEAGRDGFWIHRYLTQLGIENVVVDPASIEVSRRARRAKTDRLDVRMLLDRLRRYWRGEPKVWSVVRVPGVEAEDARRVDRERERLLKERTAHSNRIGSLLVLHGLRVPLKELPQRLGALRLVDGQPLPPALRAELEREYARLALVEAQLKALEKQFAAEIEQSTPAGAQMRQLLQLKGIGTIGAYVLIRELFGWRRFESAKQVGALVGLTPTPYDSGNSQREQGVSKAGSRRLRALLIELAWAWLRYQPESALSQWFRKRFGGSGKRSRRIGIVALARKLLVALWRYLEHGLLPTGAQLKPM